MTRRHARRAPLALAGLAAALTLVLAPTAAAAPDRNAERALRTYRALQREYYVPDQKLYRGVPYVYKGQRYTYLWPFSQALSATIAIAGIPGRARAMGPAVDDRLAGLQRYFDPNAAPPSYSAHVGPRLDHYKYYDDNEWVALELLRRHGQAPSAFLLSRAQGLFRLAVHGWDRDSRHACPGGVLFSQVPRNTERNAITNAPAAEIGYRIYLFTHDDYYLRWANRMYAWVRRCLSIEGSALYLDRIDFKGRRARAVLTYDEGPMLGANVLLYRITGRRPYLDRARAMAREAMRFFDTGRLDREPPAWVATLFENMLLVDAASPDPAYRRYMQAWADRVWRTERNPKTDVFARYTPQSTAVSTQAALARLFANLAWPRAAYE